MIVDELAKAVPFVGAGHCSLPVTSIEIYSTMSRLEKYSVKLLFQYRITDPDKVRAFRLCEERIICFKTTNHPAALKRSKNIGKESEYVFTNADGCLVLFEYIGIVDLIHLGIECETDEVWYELNVKLRPKERSSKLIRSDRTLLKKLRTGKKD